MIYFLLALIFVSKISLAFIPGFPRDMSTAIFQAGLHPYVNIALNILFGGLVIIAWFRNADLHAQQSRFFRFFIFAGDNYLCYIQL